MLIDFIVRGTLRSAERFGRVMRSRHRLGPALDMVLGGVIVASLIFQFQPGPGGRLWPRVARDALASLIDLLPVDGAGTLRAAGLQITRVGVAVFPSVLLIYRAPRLRKVWLVPVVTALFAWTSLTSLTVSGTATAWLLILGVSAAAAWLSRVRFLGWTALLPLALLLGNVPRHWTGEISNLEPAERERLLTECSLRDGERPANLTTDHIMPYYGITSLTDDILLLTGKGQPPPGALQPPHGSWWLRRHNGRFEFERPSDAWGNLWRGGVLDDTIWLGRSNYLVAAQRLTDDGPTHEKVFTEWLPAHDVDFMEAACDAGRHRVYVGETTRGGLWEFDPATGEARRIELGGRILMAKVRFDKQVVVVSTAELMVLAPGQDHAVVDRVASSLVASGFDLCRADGAVAVCDATGRLRVFELDGDGHYRFAWGLAMVAPRRVAFSHDCSRLAVTSADDQHVSMIERASHRVVETHLAGPALREVTATGPREFSIADVCSVTTYRW